MAVQIFFLLLLLLLTTKGLPATCHWWRADKHQKPLQQTSEECLMFLRATVINMSALKAIQNQSLSEILLKIITQVKQHVTRNCIHY